MSWSGGKDSALALYALQKNKDYEVSGLLTTITRDYDRSCMHGIRRPLLEKQAHSLNLPLEKVFISKDSSHEDYENKMTQILKNYLKEGISHVAFGDIFLEDLRKYREENLRKLGMEAVFPLWKNDTRKLAFAFLDEGFEAIITCVDSKTLDGKFAGRAFDDKFLKDIDLHIDPCGENGEFHSFVYAGPVFSKKVTFKKGETVFRDNRFYYCDLLDEDV